MTDQKKTRADYMTGEQRASMGNLPRTHENCIEKTEVARPGKTLHDKATGAWAPHHVRRARKMAVQKEIRDTAFRR